MSGDSREANEAWAGRRRGSRWPRLGEPEALVDSLATVADIEFWRTGHIRRDLLDRAIEIHGRSGGEEDPRATLAHQLGRADLFREARRSGKS